MENNSINLTTIVVNRIGEPISHSSPDSIRELCGKMHLHGLGFRAVKRIMNILRSYSTSF